MARDVEYFPCTCWTFDVPFGKMSIQILCCLFLNYTFILTYTQLCILRCPGWDFNACTQRVTIRSAGGLFSLSYLAFLLFSCKCFLLVLDKPIIEYLTGNYFLASLGCLLTILVMSSKMQFFWRNPVHIYCHIPFGFESEESAEPWQLSSGERGAVTRQMKFKGSCKTQLTFKLDLQR